MPRVFVSHSSADREVVEREIVELLFGHGIETWYSKADIRTADDWEKSIREGLKSCDWFLLVMTPRSQASEWVKSELHWALDRRPGRVLPVLLEDVDPTEFDLRLGRIQHVDFRDRDHEARARLLRTWGVEPAGTGSPIAPVVRAITLADYARSLGRVGPPTAIRIGCALFDALSRDHERGIFRGGLDPVRTILTWEGTAPRIELAPPPPGAGGGPADDVRSAGGLLWELVLGKPPALDPEADRAMLSRSAVPFRLSEGLSDLLLVCVAPRMPITAQMVFELLGQNEDPVPSPAVLAPVNTDFAEGLFGWFDGSGQVSGVSRQYRLERVDDPDDGAPCALLKSLAEDAPPREKQFGVLMQRCPAGYLVGKRVRLEARIRTQVRHGWGGAWLRVDGERGEGNLFFDNMHDRPIVGTTPWRGYSIEADLPEETRWINYGTLLAGSGRLWAGPLRILYRTGPETWTPLRLR
ncbi:MAG: TIR domain-containing protein [Planctomycetes bacterium]|nr:TIR domain-containing protein [Planctomycetota bacterium]